METNILGKVDDPFLLSSQEPKQEFSKYISNTNLICVYLFNGKKSQNRNCCAHPVLLHQLHNILQLKPSDTHV